MSARRHRTLLGRATVLVGTAALVVSGMAGVSSAEPGGAGAGAGDTRGFELDADQPTAAGRVSAHKAPSSALARTPQALTKLTSPDPVLVMVKLDYDALASYTGTVQGLEATSPSVTKRSVTDRTDAVRDYQGYVERQESTITGRMRAAVPGLRIGRSYQVVYGGVSARVPGNQISDLLEVPGVVAVQRDSLRQPLTDSSTEFINAPAAYNQLPGGRRDAGKGIILANIDTGVWPEHPSLTDNGNLEAPPGPERACEYGDNPLTPEDDPFECNNKLIGGKAELDTYEANNDDLPYPGSARDAEGHGSHTSSTSAGNIVEDVQTLGPVLDRINGVAPGAWVIEYRALGPARRLRLRPDRRRAVGDHRRRRRHQLLRQRRLRPAHRPHRAGVPRRLQRRRLRRHLGRQQRPGRVDLRPPGPVDDHRRCLDPDPGLHLPADHRVRGRRELHGQGRLDHGRSRPAPGRRGRGRAVRRRAVHQPGRTRHVHRQDRHLPARAPTPGSRRATTSCRAARRG